MRERERERKKKRVCSHLAGLEPATFRLTAERANRLRHKCLPQSNQQLNSSLPITNRFSLSLDSFRGLPSQARTMNSCSGVTSSTIISGLAAQKKISVYFSNLLILQTQTSYNIHVHTHDSQGWRGKEGTQFVAKTMLWYSMTKALLQSFMGGEGDLKNSPKGKSSSYSKLLQNKISWRVCPRHPHILQVLVKILSKPCTIR